MPNLNVGLIAAIFIGILSSNAMAAAYISGTGWARPCLQTGADSQLGPKCQSWCQQQYGTTMYGSQVVTGSCAQMGITDTTYSMCCINMYARQIVEQCKCADANQITVKDKNAGKAYSISVTGSGNSAVATLTCSDLYCFCNTSYYGERKSLSVSASGDCTKCPCLPDTYSQSSGAKLCGWTANNYVSLTDNTNAPSTTLANCKVGPISSGMPVEYRTYEDLVGTFTMGGYCPHSGVGVCDEITSLCSSTSADTLYTIGVPNTTSGANCWCHVNDKYLYVSGFGGTAMACNSGCRTTCNSVIGLNSDVRALLKCDE